ncbi:ABC-2 type transport system ATP-binding protein [Amphibacillus marinus]|uniref:ABC-2 type transport system ATP-binding protein n=1 Tax=Amphibacillus marinus TaxID=872970 RepID=A0A1H8Q5R8_9BACI|nr:ABC transporter ATP-binding protein [Amphibacillus marinus]SEO49560.1 ABC-2 type transport system ATP-binding protein [Amphibacillus marinus]
MISISNLTKCFKSGCLANDSISLSVAEGEIYCLLGPNGSGKSTLVNQLIGLLKPTAGCITVNQIDVVKQPHLARQLSAFQPQSQVPINGLTMCEAVELSGRIRGLSKIDARQRTEALIKRLNLEQWKTTRGEQLSGGLRRLTAFCMTCVADQKVVILDEPTNDVDPERRRLLWSEIHRMANKGTTVVVVTHNILEAEQATDRLAVLYQGKLLWEGSPAELQLKNEANLVFELTLPPGVCLRSQFNVDSFAQLGRKKLFLISINDVNLYMNRVMDLKSKGLVDMFSINPWSVEQGYLEIIAQYKETLAEANNEKTS